MNHGKCKYCGRAIVWIREPGLDASSPFEQVPSIFTFDFAMLGYVPILRTPPEPVYMRHSRVCVGSKATQLRELTDLREEVERLRNWLKKNEPPAPAHGPG